MTTFTEDDIPTFLLFNDIHSFYNDIHSSLLVLFPYISIDLLDQQVCPSLSYVGRGYLTQQGGLVHELLGYTSHVDAGAPQPPLGPRGGGLDEVQAGHSRALNPQLLRQQGTHAHAHTHTHTHAHTH